MSGKLSVRSLLDGSAALDRMKHEVEQVVRMLMGFLDKSDLEDKDPRKLGISVQFHFRDPECDWIMTTSPLDPSHYWVECWLLSTDTGACMLAYGTGGPRSIRREDVWRAHNALTVFLEGMLKEFPRLTEKLQPIIDAAS